jgi:hypothetical protein
LTKYKENYPIFYDFTWGFCRYFWEAHPVLPELNLKFLEDLELDLSKL